MASIEMGSYNQQTESEFPGPNVVDEQLQSGFGLLTVTVVGPRSKPALLTFHDIGLNASSQFLGFFGFSDMSVIAERFCVYHINAPGQEETAEKWPTDLVYPTMDQLGEMIGVVVSHFKLKSFIGLGVGLGANVLCRYTLNNPDVVNGLILINANDTQPGWVEWGYQKANVRHLRSKGITEGVVDYLMWHHFGRHLNDYGEELVNSFKEYFTQLRNPTNLAFLLECYIGRTDLGLGGDATLKCPVLLLSGSDSPHLEDSIAFNSRLDPSSSNWMKISDCCGLLLEDRPDKAAEAILLFCQGLGFLPALSHLTWRQSSRPTSAAEVKLTTTTSEQSTETE